jgi:hypothetical protein
MRNKSKQFELICFVPFQQPPLQLLAQTELLA